MVPCDMRLSEGICLENFQDDGETFDKRFLAVVLRSHHIGVEPIMPPLLQYAKLAKGLWKQPEFICNVR